MRRFYISIIVGLLLLNTFACSHKKTNLIVSFDENKVIKGPLSNFNSLSIGIKEFLDKRNETDKIGYRYNGKVDSFREIKDSYVTTKPIPEIIRESIITLLTNNGYLINNDDAKDIILSGTITHFWLDQSTKFTSIELFGSIRIDVDFIDASNNNILLKRSYQGDYSEKSNWGFYSKGFERIMDTALERMINKIGTDDELIQMLKNLKKSQSS